MPRCEQREYMGMGAVPGTELRGWELQAGPKETGKVMEGGVPIRGPEGVCTPASSRLLLLCKKETGWNCKKELLWKMFVKHPSEALIILSGQREVYIGY